MLVMFFRILSILLGTLTLFAVNASSEELSAQLPRVVFISDHGSMDSLFAASLFNDMAVKRGVAARAIPRIASGKAVEAPISDAALASMSAEGLDVRSYQPLPVSRGDISGASNIIAINLDDPIRGDPLTPVEHWTGIFPVTADHARARRELTSRINVLLDALEHHNYNASCGN